MKKLVLFIVVFIITLQLSAQITYFTDSRDAKVYSKVTIGTQTWMAENLNYSHDSSWCYTNDTSECAIYGRLYKWEQADTICPSGWHLPTDDEWKVLEEYAGMSVVSASYVGYRQNGLAGNKLKSASGWPTEGNGTDSYLFTVLPTGFRRSGGNFAGYLGNSLFWTSTESDSQAYGRMFFYQGGIERNLYTKQYGASIRCVLD